jgi:hypothetical protein
MATFDIETLTLGEMAMAEEASGLSLSKLTSTGAYRMALVLMVSASRNGESVPSWHELMNRKVLDASSSISASQADSPGAKSKD